MVVPICTEAERRRPGHLAVGRPVQKLDPHCYRPYRAPDRETHSWLITKAASFWLPVPRAVSAARPFRHWFAPVPMS